MGEYEEVIVRLDKSNTIIEELVRCKDCRWYQNYDGCFFSTAEVEPLDYCSYGERKTEEESVREVARGFMELVDAIADRKTESQTDTDFTLTYTCSFSDCENFKHFGFGEKCIECKRKQSKAMRKTEPQTEMEKSGSRAVLTARCLNCHNAKACKENHWEVCKYEPWKLTAVEDEPQTDCSWK